MDVQGPTAKQLFINFSIVLLIPLIHWVYGSGWNGHTLVISDTWKAIIILFILGMGLTGAIRELLDLRHLIKGELGWFFLTFLAAAGHIILYMEAMKFLGFDFTDEITGTENTLLVIGGILFSFFFLFELIFILANETRKDDRLARHYGWSDLFLSFYAAFGSVYIWDILLGDIGFEYQNLGYFLLAELFPATLLFLMLVLPFKRYDLMESHGVSKTRKEKNFLFLSYVLMVVMAMLPRLLQSPS